MSLNERLFGRRVLYDHSWCCGLVFESQYHEEGDPPEWDADQKPEEEAVAFAAGDAGWPKGDCNPDD